jgi:predicted Ser/Thr protein kinase
MPETTTCPQCGTALPSNAPAGICPACLMQAGLASEQDHGSSLQSKRTTPTPGFVPPEPEELAKHFPQLEILKLLGQGGMGAVYKARQSGLDRLVAVKILPPEVGVDPAFAVRFTREARALARLSHQNVADGLYYFIMEYVDGTNLRQLIAAGGLKPEQALAIVPQICEALQFAHNEGIVHRDIKPENILVDKQGRVKIADFGLAKLLGQDAGDHSLTATQQVMGTLRYMAPEQIQGAHAVDHRADIYSLGVIFYELLTGELPTGRFAPPSKKVQIDVRLDEIVLRALEHDREQRYQQASDIKTDVDAISSTPHAKGNRREATAAVEADWLTSAQRQVRGPALGLLFTGVLGCVLSASMAAFVLWRSIVGPFTGEPGVLIVLALFLLPMYGLIVFSATRMRQLTDWQLVYFFTLLAILIPPVNIVGLPLGIWALAVLHRSGVRKAFKQNANGGHSQALASEPRSRTGSVSLGANPGEHRGTGPALPVSKLEPDRRDPHASDITSDIKTDMEAIPKEAELAGVAIPKTARDGVVFLRLSVFNLVFWLVWSALLAGLQWGYLSDAKWYFQKELPYDYLNGAWGWVSLLFAFFFGYWWYLLAKSPETPRSLSDAWRTLQTPDRRALGLWMPGGAFLAIGIGAMVLAISFADDDVQSITLTASIIAAPLAAAGSCCWAYRQRVGDLLSDQGSWEKPGTGPGPFPHAGLPTIVERELRGAWHWIAGDSASPKLAPLFPGRLLTLLSLAGCLMLMVPWMHLHIDQEANVKQFWSNAELPGSFSRTLYGSDRWPGIATGVAFGLLTLLLIMTPGSRPLTWQRAAVMSVLAAFAVVQTFLFKPNLENGNFAIPIILHEDARTAGQAGDASSDTRDVVGEPRMERVMSKGSVQLKHIEHQAIYREGFYGSLALALVLLVFSGVGVRHAMAWDAEKTGEGQISLPRRQLTGPAIALMLYGLFLLFPAALCFTNGFDIADGNDATSASVGVAMMALSFLLLGLAGLLMRGGWHMLAVESYRAALLASFLGQPIGLWGLFVLSRPDVKAAFPGVLQIRSEPRVSRFAIAGAIWAFFGLLAVVPVLYFIGLQRFRNGSALPTDMISAEPPLVFTIFMGVLLAIGVGAPIGTTIYGALSIGHIKRSGGKIIGLPLAVVDALLFPLLATGCIPFALTHIVQIVLWTKIHTGYVYKSDRLADIIATNPANRPDILFLILDTLVALVVCFLIGLAVWRAIAGHNRLGDQFPGKPVGATSGADQP